jgi:hypothetical protein
MPALNPVSRRELVGKLKHLGFEGPFAGGKHQWMRRGTFRLTIPNSSWWCHRSWLRPAIATPGISVNEWIAA